MNHTAEALLLKLRSPPAHRPASGVSGWMLGAAALFLLMAPGPRARATVLSEYELKAAFLFNFARFVEWPAEVLPPANQPIVIGIVGTDPFGESLDAIVKGETIKGHRLVVRRCHAREEIEGCQVLYIGRSEAARLPVILARLKGRPILTVSDNDRFAFSGGIIGLVMEEGRVRIQINLDRARESQLVISAKLLRPALVIRDNPQSMLESNWSICGVEPSALRRADPLRAQWPAILAMAALHPN